MNRFSPSLILALGLAPASAAPDYAAEIQPILSETCFKCHGADSESREAGLRLDEREGATSKGRKHEIAIVPGDAGASELMARITSTDPELVMPPPDEKNPVGATDVAKLEAWIAAGAEYAEHWAFVAPEKAGLPGGAGNPIDRFVLAKLPSEGAALAAAAPGTVLARRLYLDLIGLPPSPADAELFARAFATDADAAVRSLVEDLMERAEFGEKWARHWLDLARYSDSNGFEKDFRREQWAWRDWVIDAINADMPYDQFLVEQVAGDLLPDRTQDQLIASGFLRNGMINEEGAIIPEQFRIEGILDRIDAIGKSVLGLSVQCAQCHTHKFDPLTQDEYYGIFAFLNDTYEAQSGVYTEAQQAAIAEIENGACKQEDALRQAHPGWEEELAAWIEKEKASQPAWAVLETHDVTWLGGLNHPTQCDDHSVLILGHPTSGGSMYLLAKALPEHKGSTGIRLEALLHGDLPFRGPGRSPLGIFAVSEIKVETKAPGDDSPWVKVEMTCATADFAEGEHLLEPFYSLKPKEKDHKEHRIVGPAAFLIDGKPETGWRADRGPGLRNAPSAAVLRFAAPLDLAEGSLMKITLDLNHGGAGDDLDNAQLGRMRFSLTRSPEPAATVYDHAAALALTKPESERDAAGRAALFAAWRGAIPELAPYDDAIAKLRATIPEARTSVLHLAATDPLFRRETRLLDRGVWDQPRHLVTPHTPAALHPLAAEQPTRLDFARWLADPGSPLTARVQVNRVWQAVFGTGIVETPEDFGTRAPRPVHREMLDWLAVDFMEHGWGLKHLLRTITNSHTYRQDSTVTAEQYERDPGNALFARGPRFRAEAEVVRDIALSAAGLLHQQVGGPSIFPPVPQSVLNYNFVKPDYWHPPTGPQRYRRALYMFRKRSMPDPSLDSFDAPNGDSSCARRVRSNTPLAALVSLNEPVFVEAAQGLALRVLREGGATEAGRIDHAFRLCTNRSPDDAERAAISRFLTAQRGRIAEGWVPANQVATGDATRFPELPPGTTPQDAAAWTITARVLLNLDETLSKY